MTTSIGERLEKYIANENIPGATKEGQPTEEFEAQRKWSERDAKDAPRIDLAMGDAEMIHISGAMTAW